MAADETVSRRSLLKSGGATLSLGLAPGVASAAIVRKRPSRDRLEAALDRIADPQGEGSRVFLTLYSKRARKAADASDERARSGTSLGPIDGKIVGIKDLFDVAGEPTRAGSKTRADAPPAHADATVVSRLRTAGAVIVGKNNMVEFAFSGVGQNPHFGTPGNHFDRSRAPGGSSSGGGVAVADLMCDIALGTDTGGSCRIPAALNGVAGYKPSKARVPTQGAFPLSPTLDSIGPLAANVEACAAADAVLAGEAPWSIEPAPLKGLRIGVPQGLPLSDLDESVALRFANALNALAPTGAVVTDEQFPIFDEMARLNTPVSLVSAEAFRVHRDRLAEHGKDYDPLVLARMEAGRAVSDEALAKMLASRAALVKAMDARLAEIDVLILPTTPILAPKMSDVADAAEFGVRNRLLLRNTGLANSFDLCAISLPLPRFGGPPVGLMLMARNGQDRRLFQIAAAVEGLFLM